MGYIVHVRLQSKNYLWPKRILHFKVTDNGLGIPEKDLDKIFEAFYRSRNYEDDSIVGSGVGLNLTRSIVEQHKGIIWAENEKEEGTSIHVLLPYENNVGTDLKSYSLKSYENEILKYSISDEKEEKEKTHTLLLVEDNRDLLQYLEKIFRNQYHLRTASNGKEALFVLEDSQPDLILMDVIMPEMDGIKLCRTVKNSLLHSHIPVLLMSAESSPLKMKEGYKAGADDYIVKPFEISLLKTRIENLLITRKNIRKKFEKKISVEELNIEVSNEEQQWLKQYTEIIKKNFSNSNLDVDFICQEMGMSRANFYRRVKKLTNLTPAEMIKKLRMEVAAQLLCETDLSVSEIIAKVAFNGSGYFAATFKNIYGMTPKEYRKKYSHKA